MRPRGVRQTQAVISRVGARRKWCYPAPPTGASGQTPRRRQAQGNADQERERAPRKGKGNSRLSKGFNI
uniref:hypothetical protein n=1 Tax=Okeania sp. SIO2F4 TaxID=2607790 RepID=UPI0025FD0FD9|nr:hypothetical protein [Okeania sp. SIO2F4]